MICLGELAVGRATIVGKSSIATRMASVIAVRYSAVRKQFYSADGEGINLIYAVICIL